MSKSMCPAGALLLLETGDGYNSVAERVVRVTQDFCLRSQRRAFVKKYPQQGLHWCFSWEKFAEHLVAQGIVEKVPYHTLHLGQGRSYKDVRLGRPVD